MQLQSRFVEGIVKYTRASLGYATDKLVLKRNALRIGALRWIASKEAKMQSTPL